MFWIWLEKFKRKIRNKRFEITTMFCRNVDMSKHYRVCKGTWHVCEIYCCPKYNKDDDTLWMTHEEISGGDAE